MKAASAAMGHKLLVVKATVEGDLETAFAELEHFPSALNRKGFPTAVA